MDDVIRKMRERDKEFVLGYCKNTFGWGDYMEHVWDDWMQEGLFLTLDADAQNLGYGEQGLSPDVGRAPVGVCHVHLSRGQIWLEGIRVHPKCRRRGIGARLVSEAEQVALGRHAAVGMGGADGRDMNDHKINNHFKSGAARDCGESVSSRMLIDTSNTASLRMANMLGYARTGTWKYYTLKTCPPDAPARGPAAGNNNNNDCDAVHAVDPRIHTHYVSMWRWFETDLDALQAMASAGMVMVSRPGDCDRACCATIVALMAVSESVGDDAGPTLYATLYTGGKNPADSGRRGPDCLRGHTRQVTEMLQRISDAAASHACTSIEIFAQDVLPRHAGLSSRYTFCLVEKRMR